MSSDQMPAPGKIKLIKFPPPGQEKTSNARDMPGGDVEASIWLIHYRPKSWKLSAAKRPNCERSNAPIFIICVLGAIFILLRLFARNFIFGAEATTFSPGWSPSCNRNKISARAEIRLVIGPLISSYESSSSQPRVEPIFFTLSPPKYSRIVGNKIYEYRLS